MRGVVLAVAVAVVVAGCGSGVPSSFSPNKDKYCAAYRAFDKKAEALLKKQQEGSGDEWASADATPEEAYEGYKEEWSLEVAGLSEMAKYARNQKMFDEIVSAVEEIEVLLTRTKLDDLVAPPGSVAEDFATQGDC